MKLLVALSLSAFAIAGSASQAQEINAHKLAASQLGGAVPINPENWVTTTDRERSGSNGEGVTRFELTISPTGSVEQCRVTESSSFAALDQLTCSIMISRGHFRPARDQNGRPIASTFANQVRWARPGHTWVVPAPSPYLSLSVARLPERVSNPAYVRVLAVVGVGGQVEACEGQGKKADVALNAVACKQLGPQVPDLVGHDQSGAPRRVMHSLLVEFSTGPAKLTTPTVGTRN